MKKTIWLLIVVCILSYAGYNIYKSHAAEKARKQFVADIDLKLAAMTSKWDATSTWESSVGQKSQNAWTKLITMDLQKAWLAGHPILFAGTIDDISMLDSSHCLVALRRSIITSPKYVFDKELILHLACSKTAIDSFRAAHPDVVSDFSLLDGVAVIAIVLDMKNTYELQDVEEGGSRKVEVIEGEGRMLDILYIGDYSF